MSSSKDYPMVMKTDDRIRRCTRCIHSEIYPRIKYDSEGVCNYCRYHEKFDQLDLDQLKNIFSKVKSKGKYDCLVPVSGGMDSTYVLYLVIKKFNLRPLAFNFDNGWQHPMAKKNLEKAVNKLGCDLKFIHLDWNILKNLYLAFMKASVPEICAPCMVGIYSYMFKIAIEEKISLIINGSFIRKQGSPPLNRLYYRDGRYFNHILREYAPEVHKNNYCALSLKNYFNYFAIKKIKIINLPDYLKDWDEKEIANVLKDEFDWTFPKDEIHKFDCVMFPVMEYWQKEKFGWDHQEMELAAQVRSGMVKAEDALKILKMGKREPRDRIEIVLKGLGLNEVEFSKLLRKEPKTFLDYKNYYSFLSKFRLPIKLLVKIGLVQDFVYDYYFTH